MIPEVGKEYTIALKWLQKHAPKVVSDQRVFTELFMSSLQTDVSIVTVAREFSNPIQTPELDRTNAIYHIDRPEPELFEEVRYSQPVKVKDFWVRDNPMRPGKPDTAGILEALGKGCIPWRYIFVDKGETKPDILKLSKV